MDFPNLSAAKRIIFDLETHDANLKKLGPGWARRDVTVVGIAVGVDDLPSHYYPIAHATGPNLNRDHVLAWVQDGVLAAGKHLGGHNVSYDVGGLLAEGLTMPAGLDLHDSMVGAALIDENLDHYSLESLSNLWLGEGKVEEGIREYADEHDLDPKADLWRMPAAVVGPDACGDVDRTRQLLEWEESQIASDSDVQRAYALESSLLPLSIQMTWNGIRIDEAALERANARFRKLKDAAVRAMSELTGVEVEPWKVASCVAAFQAAGVTVPRAKKMVGNTWVEGNYTITAPWLEAMALHHPVARLLLNARQADKARSTFVEGWRSRIVNGRLHPMWHQTRSDDGGTISFRYSCSEPNLQQVPYRNPDMAKILRPVFLPDEGETLHSLDYSQQEPRLLVHYAYSNGVVGAPAAHALYQDRGADFHQMASELTDLERDVAKQINLGIIYGMGQQRLADKIGKALAEAKAILGQYRDRMPFMHAMQRIAMNLAAQHGYILTKGGHKRRFDKWEPDGWTDHLNREMPLPRGDAEQKWKDQALRRAYTFTGLNALIQTSAAAQMKLAMAACYAAGIIPKLQIHDELLLSGSQQDATIAEQLMITAMPLTVPTVVDRAGGSSWYEAADFKKDHPVLSRDHYCAHCAQEN